MTIPIDFEYVKLGAILFNGRCRQWHDSQKGLWSERVADEWLDQDPCLVPERLIASAQPTRVVPNFGDYMFVICLMLLFTENSATASKSTMLA
jgi:hypothetical protein